MGGLLTGVYCVLNTSMVFLTTSEIRNAGTSLLINMVARVQKLFCSREDEETGSKNEPMPTVSRMVSMSTKHATIQAQQIAALPMHTRRRSSSEEDIIFGRQRVHFIDHEKQTCLYILCYQYMYNISIIEFSGVLWYRGTSQDDIYVQAVRGWP